MGVTACLSSARGLQTPFAALEADMIVPSVKLATFDPASPASAQPPAGGQDYASILRALALQGSGAGPAGDPAPNSLAAKAGQGAERIAAPPHQAAKPDRSTLPPGLCVVDVGALLARIPAKSASAADATSVGEAASAADATSVGEAASARDAASAAQAASAGEAALAGGTSALHGGDGDPASTSALPQGVNESQVMLALATGNAGDIPASVINLYGPGGARYNPDAIMRAYRTSAIGEAQIAANLAWIGKPA
jgi:hypothetical protein